MKEEDLEGCETLLEKQVKDHSRNDVVVKKYFSRGGNFITGIDTESEVIIIMILILYIIYIIYQRTIL